MATATSHSETPPVRERKFPYLENGDCLTVEEFLRRWEAMPDLKHAELINGVVFMNAAVRFRDHGKQVARIYFWLGMYDSLTPHLNCGAESSVQITEQALLQPDACLFLPAGAGGMCQISKAGYLSGPPELIVEVSASSASRDLHQKREIYEQSGVKEYVVWSVFENRIQWFVNRGGSFQEISPDEQHIFRSEIFPGLWLNAAAMLSGEMKTIRETVEKGAATPEHAAFVQAIQMQEKQTKDNQN